MFISFELTELVPYLPTISCGVNFSKTTVMHFHFVTDRYNDLKDKTRTKQSGLSEQEKKKLIEEGNAQALALFKKKISDT